MEIFHSTIYYVNLIFKFNNIAVKLIFILYLLHILYFLIY